MSMSLHKSQEKQVGRVHSGEYGVETARGNGWSCGIITFIGRYLSRPGTTWEIVPEEKQTSWLVLLRTTRRMLVVHH